MSYNKESSIEIVGKGVDTIVDARIVRQDAVATQVVNGGRGEFVAKQYGDQLGATFTNGAKQMLDKHAEAMQNFEASVGNVVVAGDEAFKKAADYRVVAEKLLQAEANRVGQLARDIEVTNTHKEFNEKLAKDFYKPISEAFAQAKENKFVDHMETQNKIASSRYVDHGCAEGYHLYDNHCILDSATAHTE